MVLIQPNDHQRLEPTRSNGKSQASDCPSQSLLGRARKSGGSGDRVQSELPDQIWCQSWSVEPGALCLVEKR